jgi:hypothetical protein
MIAVLFSRSEYFQGPAYRGFILGGALSRDGCLLMPAKPTGYDCVDVYMIDVMQKGA